MIKIISFIVISIGTAIALFGWICGYLEVTSIIQEGGTMKFVTTVFLFFLALLFILYVILLSENLAYFMLLYLHHLL